LSKVLKKNFKNIPIEGDIRNVKGEKYKADVVTGGFPCQPFSVAGKRKGTDDDRYLWDETIRVVRECKPKWFIGENVEGLINIQDGMVLRQVQDDLEKEGFEVQCIIIPASGIGAWHQRKEFGLWATPNTMDTLPPRSEKAVIRQMTTARKGSTKPSNLREQVHPETMKMYGWMYPTPTQDSASERTKKYKQGGTPLPLAVKMFPTPSASCQMDVVAPPETVQQNSKGWSVTRVGTGTKFGAKLNDVVNKIEKMYNTPTTNDSKNLTFPQSQKNRTSIVGI